MTNAITTVSAPLAEQLKQAEWFARSGFMPKHLDSAAKVYAVVTLGQELGLGPWAAINNIYLAGNKPTINTNLMLSLIHASGLLEHFDVTASETTATVTMARRGVGTYTATFSMADANTAGLTTGYNAQTWKKYPRNMLKARAISDCARTLFADVLLGMYTPEELGARVTMNESGDIVVIDAEPPRHTDTETGEIVTVTKPEPAAAPTPANGNGAEPQAETTPGKAAQLSGAEIAAIKARADELGIDKATLGHLLKIGKNWNECPFSQDAAITLLEAHATALKNGVAS